MKRFIFNFILFGCVFSINTFAQVVTTDSLEAQQRKLVEHPIVRPGFIELDEQSALELIDAQPSFGIFKDNYFITGVPLNRSITKESADVKFQISIRQRLTQSVLPYKTFLFLTLSQKSFWSIYNNSSPFRDTNFNPSLSLGKILIVDNELKGAASLAVEHESNGRDSLSSRSWNMVSVTGSYFFNPRFKVEGKLWLPFWIDKDNNPDIVELRGVGYLEFHYRSANERLWVSWQMNPRKQFGNVNHTFELNFKMGRNANQYWFLQYYTGYGESMMDYTRYSSTIRVGISIKPNFLSVF